MFDRHQISEKIHSFCKKVFDDESLNYSDADINRGINVFFNISQIKLGLPLIDGFYSSIEDSLTRVCITNIGQVNPLKDISTSIDTFLKRTLCMLGASYSSCCNKMFKDLVNATGELGNIDGYNNNGDSWRTDGTGRFVLYKAIVPRNINAHNSPEWNMAVVVEHVMYVLATYIYIVLRCETRLKNCSYDIYKSPISIREIDDSDLQAFDFINYSKTSRDLKVQVIECFLLRSLYKDGDQTLETLSSRYESLTGIKNVLIVEQRMKKLIRDQSVSLCQDTGLYKISELQKQKLSASEINCITNVESFKQRLGDIISGSVLDGLVDEVYSVFSKFISERFRQTAGQSFEENEVNVIDNENSFFVWLNSELNDDSKSREIYKNIIELCRENDIVYRIRIGEVISGLAEMPEDAFSIGRMMRIVYLDTQIMLALLCVLYDDFKPGNIQALKNAIYIKRIGDRENIQLRFPVTYLPEVEDQIKIASGLTYWETFPSFLSGQFSKNLFYQHYINLHKLGELPNDISSFSDYMYSIFKLDENDLNDGWDMYRKHTLPNVLRKLIEKELHIDITSIPYYDEKELELPIDLFVNARRYLRSTKSDWALRHDAIVGTYLFETVDKPKPFFVTRDKSFTNFRKEYASVKFRGESYFWHLFNPIRFITNIEMLGLRINKTLLSDDLLLQIDDDDTRRNAKFFMDVNSQLTEIEGLTLAQKRKRLSDNFKLFSGKEFADFTEDDLEYVNELATKINRIWDGLIVHFTNNGKKVSFFKAMKDDSLYAHVIAEIQKFSKGVETVDEAALYNMVETLINTESPESFSSNL